MTYTEPTAPVPARSQGKARAALTLGLLGLIFGILAPIGLGLALAARGAVKRGASPRLVLPALIVSAITTVLWLAGVVIALSLQG